MGECMGTMIILLKIYHKPQNNTFKKLIIIKLHYIRLIIITTYILKELITTRLSLTLSFHKFRHPTANSPPKDYFNNIYQWPPKRKSNKLNKLKILCMI